MYLMRRIYKINALYVFTLTLFISFTSHAKYDGKIIEVKRALSLDATHSHNKEFYIDAGSKMGLKTNHIIPVLRKKSFIDPLENKTVGDLYLPVGEVKVIHVGSTVSVARIHKVPKRDKLPELDYATFMVGDRLDLDNKYITKKRKKSSKYSKRNSRKKSRRDIASVNKKAKGVFNGNYSFPEPVRSKLQEKTTSGEGLLLNGTSGTGINSQYLIRSE